MRIGTEDDVAKVVTAVTVAFLIAGLRMFHLVLNSLLIFCGIHAGGSFGYGQWSGSVGPCSATSSAVWG